MNKLNKKEEVVESGTVSDKIVDRKSFNQAMWGKVFLGKDEVVDDLIIDYLKVSGDDGATLSSLILYFCKKHDFLSERGLYKRLETLITLGIIKKDFVRGTSFYTIIK